MNEIRWDHDAVERRVHKAENEAGLEAAVRKSLAKNPIRKRGEIPSIFYQCCECYAEKLLSLKQAAAISKMLPATFRYHYDRWKKQNAV